MLNGWQNLTPEDVAKIEIGIIEDRVLGGPWQIELQPTNLCDLNCFFCISKMGRHGESLDWAVLKDFLIRNRRHDLRMLRLTGGGEPLQYPQIQELIELCGEQGILLENINTNGTLLEPLAERIVRAGLGWINISLNESDPARYARTMQTGERSFHQAVAGIQAIVAARDHIPAERRPRLWLQYFLWKGSAPHIFQMYEFARSLRVDTIFFRTIFGNMGQEKLGERDRAMVEGQLREIIREDCQSGEYRLHFELSRSWGCITSPTPNSCATSRRVRKIFRICVMPIRGRSIVSSAGIWPASSPMAMCFHVCSIMKCRAAKLAIFIASRWEAIWHGKRYQLYREQIRKLIYLRGHMEPSLRFHRFIERKCTQCDLCQYTYNLATPDFYARVLNAINAHKKTADLIHVYTKNFMIHLAHRILQRPH